MFQIVEIILPDIVKRNLSVLCRSVLQPQYNLTSKLSSSSVKHTHTHTHTHTRLFGFGVCCIWNT